MIAFPGLAPNGFKTDTLKPDGFRQSLYALLLCTLTINLLSLALPVMTLQVYDRILPNPGTGTLPVLVTGVCLAIVLEALLRLSRSYVIGRAGAKYEHLMSCRAMKTILNADLSQMARYGIAEHLHRIGSVSKLKDFYNGFALTVLLELAFVPLFLALVIYISGMLAIVPAFILALFMIVSACKGSAVRNALKEREQADDKRFNFLIESLEGVHTLKAFALENFFARRYEMLEDASTKGNYRVTQETSATFNTGAIFSHLMVASVITAGAWCVLNGILTTGGLIATLLLSGRMMQPIQKALVLWARYQDFLIAKEHIDSLFATPQRQIEPHEPEMPLIPCGIVKIENASFRHINDEEPLLSGIDLELKRGEAVHISGAHGSGKTTLLKMIAGIYPASDGSIRIDNAPVNSFKAETLVRHVGFVRADALIFRGTIRDNMTCFGQIDETQAQDIAAALHVDMDVAKLPGGFDTFLSGNNTDSISPALKQRIAIVRSLAAHPKIILSDAAERILDSESRLRFLNLLADLKSKTAMVLVSGDSDICALADRHYRIENGTLIEHANDIGKTITETGAMRT